LRALKSVVASEKGGNKPLDFVRSIRREKHIALFYEDDAYARRIEFGFIEAGLGQGEHCFYLTHSDEETRSMEELMRENKVLRDSMAKGTLLTYKDSFVPASPDDAVVLFEERRSRMSQVSKGPYRLVGATIPEVKTPEQVAALGEADSVTQEFIAGSSMTVLCSLAPGKVPNDLRSDWFLKMIGNHHSAIFAPKKSEGVAFEMR
jgi:hypothetical protein